MSRFGVRAMPRPPKAGLGMSIKQPPSGGKVKAATISSRTFTTQGQPMYADWDATSATQIAYLGHTYVMRCVRLRADTIASLPFQAGPDPLDPSTINPDAPLAKFLGPASPQAPGGPNHTTTSRALWAWSIVQFIVTGRMCWELQLGPGSKQDRQIEALWPLPAAAVLPIPSNAGEQEWWSGFKYQTPIGIFPMELDRVFYHWKPSADDWRQPESPLMAAKLPVQIAVACDRYMWNLLKNGMVANKIVIAPPFAQEEDRRAWEEQFFAEFSGFDNAGKTIFAEAENEYDATGKLVDQANVQVIDLSMKSTDAQLLETLREAKSDINIALGVAKSLLGDASQRIYANSDSEYRNFWTTTALADVTEMQDGVNVNLAPRLGPDVGWFDLSQVVALQPPQIFQPPALKDAIDEGVVTPQQAARLLSIPAAVATGEDVSTAPIGEELAEGASTMMRSMAIGRRAPGFPDTRDGWMDAPEGWRFIHRGVNSYTHKAGMAGWGLKRVERARFRVHGHRAVMPDRVGEVLDVVGQVRDRRAGQRAQDRIAQLEAQVASLTEPELTLSEIDGVERLGDVLSSLGV